MPAVTLDFIVAQLDFGSGLFDGGEVAAGDGGNNADHVALFHRCFLLLHVANIFVVDVDIDKVTKAAVFVIKMLSEVRKLLD